jgi:type II secretory pathway pseudopilin PulG
MSSFRRHLADERGFTMVAVTVSMMVLGLFAVGAWAAANNDLRPGRQDIDRKRAYEAAESGLQWYSYQLARDTNFWAQCGHAQTASVPAYVQNKGTRSSWRLVGGSDTDTSATTAGQQGKFAIELMPVDNTKPCTTSDPSGRLLDQGVLRVRSTGAFNGKTRQVVGTFRRSGFLDYIWYTKWETIPPAAYTSGSLTPSWAAANCDTNRANRDDNCTELQFLATDSIKGPLHTEDDSLLVCGAPTFGRTSSDKIEILGSTSASNAFVQNGGCSGTPNWVGTLQYPPHQVDLPDSNTALSTVADRTYSGTTCLQFNTGDTMSVYSNLTCAGSPSSTVTLTGDTTIWVANSGSCSVGYAYYQKYTNPATCGDVGVKGTYSKNITIGSANDIVVVGDLKHTGDGLMGLVANQFVRVYHPVTWSGNTCGDNTLGTPVLNIDAAVLATTGSFINDNWTCGDALGTLNLSGAIAQKFRGAVGQTSQSCDRYGHNCVTSLSGYVKNYVYDDRLRYREPPNFLDPVTVTWNLLRESEQSPVQN